MIRSFAVWGAVLFLMSCTSTSLGLCDADSDCLSGLSCQEGVCVGCGGDSECKAWEACTTNRRCELRAGMCENSSQCESWETCGADSTCVVAAGMCASAADCKAHESCDVATKKCILQAGRCNTTADCPDETLWPESCGSDNQCHPDEASGNDVLLWGTLGQGGCDFGAISSVMTPSRALVGIGCDVRVSGRGAVLSPSGRIHYIDSGQLPARVKVFTPDRFKLVQGKLEYPFDGHNNDPELPAPGCNADQNVSSILMQAGTGAILYTCGSYGVGSTYYNVKGDIVTDRLGLLAWNADNYFLTRNSFSQMFVRAPDETILLVQGLPPSWTLIDARAHPTGFRAALSIPLSNDISQEQLWHISNDGEARLEATYGDVPETVIGHWMGALDTAGVLYTEATLKGNPGLYDDAIVRRTPDDSPGQIVYSEATAPSVVNFGADYKQLFNFMHGSHLFAGP
ncbi:hypothetical protein [Corallococcus exercitus]|uniref:Disintegrin domain-containing protein n=1 Tax=Corallococcus exercitus TaxID=2316736 RepID=A0A7Y4NEI5_9BACT|nr:hypothetical protein [Corallococcus exercitus]NOK11573.1 hypothetical protein [Corallococcus exercitus]